MGGAALRGGLAPYLVHSTRIGAAALWAFFRDDELQSSPRSCILTLSTPLLILYEGAAIHWPR